MTAAAPDVRVSVDAGRLTVAITGDLVLDSLAQVERALQAPLARGPRAIALEMSSVGRLDASGVAIAVKLHRAAKSLGIPFEVKGVAGERKLLVDLALRGQDPQPDAPHIGFVREVGVAAAGIGEMLVDLLRFCGEVSAIALQIVRRPSLLRWHDTIVAMARHGTDAVPVVGLLGFLIGAIIAFQTMDPMARYGAKLQVADVVGVSIIRELGPLITAILVAGRSGAAFAATIGTMKVAQEIDALRTFGIPPMRFLVVPRFIACVTMTPLLAIFANVMGVAGGWLILSGEGFTLRQYLVQVQGAVDSAAFLQGLVKAAVFGSLIAGIGCERGMRTPREEGARAVGDSTTRAVVASIIMIIIADAVLGSFFYVLGI